MAISGGFPGIGLSFSNLSKTLVWNNKGKTLDQAIVEICIKLGFEIENLKLYFNA